MDTSFQMSWHVGDDYPEWGSQPRGPLVRLDRAHQGEWMGSVIGADLGTGRPMVYQILRCELCILTHAWPLPEAAILARFYTERFYQEEKQEMVERYRQDSHWWGTCVHFPLIAQCITSVQRAVPTQSPLRFLDIGAGVGIALDVAARLDCVTYGIEPNHGLCTALALRGHTMLHGTLDSIQDHAVPYHIIYLYETLEHLPNPEDSLLRCYDFLAPGGVLAVVVPNDYNPLQLEACQTLGIPPYWVAPPQHLSYFTPKTLQLLMRRCGFTIREARGTYPMERFLLAGRNYVGHDVVGRQCHQQRMQEELGVYQCGLWTQREAMYRRSLAHRIGREMVYIGQKDVG